MQKKHSIHPAIDHLFSKDYHFNYKPIGRSLTLNKVLKQLHKMANPPNIDPLIVSPAENSANAQEIIQSVFVKKALENCSNQNEILVVALKKAMVNVGFLPGRQQLHRARERERERDREKERETEREKERIPFSVF